MSTADYDWLKNGEGLNFAKQCSAIARNWKTACMMPEHILYALLTLNAEEAANSDIYFFEKCKGNYEAVLYRIDDYLDEQPTAKKPCYDMSGAFALRYWRRVKKITEDFFAGTPSHSILLLALVQEEDSFAQFVLVDSGVREQDIIDALANGKNYQIPPENGIAETTAANDKSDGKAQNSEFLVELVQMAKQEKIDPLIGRRKEVEMLLRALNRKKKSAPVLVGAPGVGKTAVVEGLAWLVSRNDVPHSMKDIKIYALLTGSLVAGTCLQGEFEKRMTAIIQFIEKDPNAILFLDELHNVMNAGPSSKNESGAAGNLLKPEIASGRLRCIGATTDDEYRKTIASDKAFARRFHTIHVEEPTPEECMDILKGLEPAYESFHKVHFTDDILQRIVTLTQRYVNSLRLPDKAIDVMDAVGAKYRLHAPAGQDGNPTATEADIDEAVCQMANLPSIPSSTGKEDQLSSLSSLEAKLNAVVFGQEKATGLIARAIKIAKCGLMPERAGTIGSFFFSGPSGVGKTEVAKRLAEIMGVKLIRFDMSEYSSEQMVTRFVGSAPGLVGYDEGGQLTNAVRDCPHCVLLLDEVEKAHPSIHSLLLQVMDNGILTDSRGFKTDFHNVILIMTGNVGCNDAAVKSSHLGFGAAPDAPIDPDIIENALKRAFSPEFRARLSASIIFNPLGIKEIERIVDFKFKALAKLASTRDFTLTLSPEAQTNIAKRALAMNQGARPVDKILENDITAKLVDIMVEANGEKNLTAVLENNLVILQPCHVKPL